MCLGQPARRGAGPAPPHPRDRRPPAASRCAGSSPRRDPRAPAAHGRGRWRRWPRSSATTTPSSPAPRTGRAPTTCSTVAARRHRLDRRRRRGRQRSADRPRLPARPGTFAIADYYVHPEARGRGAGSLLVDWGERRTGEAGLGAVRPATTANDNEGKGLLESRGYRYIAASTAWPSTSSSRRLRRSGQKASACP